VTRRVSWFCCDSAIYRDPRVATLPDASHRWCYVVMLALEKSGELDGQDVRQFWFAAGVSVDCWAEALERMQEVGLLGDDLRPVGFSEWQKSALEADRSRRYRARRAGSQCADDEKRKRNGNDVEPSRRRHASVTPPSRNEHAPVTTETETDKKKNTLSDSATPKPDHAPTKEIISHLNQKAGTSFRASSKKTQTLIKARMREGYAVEDFIAVIDRKVEEWRGTEMAQYLRPETLFGPKFESYRNGIGGGKHGEESPKLDRAIIEELKFQLSENGPTGAAEWIDRQKPALQNALIDMVGRLPK
jgi:uncharacterized phage protein (TIGR02220 family)